MSSVACDKRDRANTCASVSHLVILLSLAIYIYSDMVASTTAPKSLTLCRCIDNNGSITTNTISHPKHYIHLILFSTVTTVYRVTFFNISITKINVRYSPPSLSAGILSTTGLTSVFEKTSGDTLPTAVVNSSASLLRPHSSISSNVFSKSINLGSLKTSRAQGFDPRKLRPPWCLDGISHTSAAR